MTLTWFEMKLGHLIKLTGNNMRNSFGQTAAATFRLFELRGAILKKKWDFVP